MVTLSIHLIDDIDLQFMPTLIMLGHKTISCGNNYGVDVIDFDEFDNGDESDDEHQLNNINIRLKQIRRAYKRNVEARRDLKFLKCGKRRVKAKYFSIMVGYVKGKDGPKKFISLPTKDSDIPSTSNNKGKEVIENDATLPITKVVESVTTEMPITTAEEKAQGRLEVKARSTLMMGIRNEHQLKFNSIKDAKKLLEAVEKRFGGNAATKKTQRNLLKQQYENFTATNLEMLDQTFDKLQKLESQLELLEEKLTQEDVNQKLLRINTAHRVSTASTQVNAAYSINIDNLSDVVICLFLASQPNSPQLVYEDLEQIHPIDMEEMDLRWQMAMLTMRARREFRAPRNQDNKNKESSRRSVHVETSTFITLVSCDVPPTYTRNFMPPTHDLSFTGLYEFVNKPVAKNCKAKSNEEEPKEKKINTARPKAVVNVVKGNNSNVVKASACWVWKPKHKVLDHVSKHNNASITLEKFDYVDAQGRSKCSKHMTGNMSYLTDYEEINRGYVAFGGNPKGGKITGKDHLGKFDGKADTCFFVGYSLNSKAFRVLNSRKIIVEENLHIRFSETTPNVVVSGPYWLFDINALTRTMNYKHIVTGTQPNAFADPKSSHDDGSKPLSDDGKKVDKDPRKENECNDQEKEDNVNSTNNVNNLSSTVNVVGTNEDNKLLFDPNMPALEDVSIFNFLSDDKDEGTLADINNLHTTIQVSPVPTTLIHKDHPHDQVIGDLQSATQIRKMSKNLEIYFVVYQMDKKSAFLYGKIEEKVYVCQSPGFEDPDFPDRVYKVEKSVYGLHQAPRAWFTEVKTTSTSMETQKPLLKDEVGEEVDVNMYRLMIGSLMYLTSSRPDIMFAVCAYARYQVNLKVSYLHAVKRIFRYLKGQPKLGLWYPKDSPFDLVAYTDSDYIGASLDRKSTTGGCQFLGCRLISW
nr:uncharacterized mitochondrial protein AtMg00810-like [Tanacetum cinerariifolium]